MSPPIIGYFQGKQDLVALACLKPTKTKRCQPGQRRKEALTFTIPSFLAWN